MYVSPATSDRLLRRVAQGQNDVKDNPIDSLSDRELEVFQMIGRGLRTREIAERLCLSVKTIETYRENIKDKLNLEHGTELIRRAVHWQMSQEAPQPDEASASGA